MFKSYMQLMFKARFMLVFYCKKRNCLVAVSLKDPVKTGNMGIHPIGMCFVGGMMLSV